MPTPPVPVNVTRRHSSSAVAIADSSSSRPTNDVNCAGKFPGSASSERIGGKSRRQTGVRHLEHAHRLGEVTQAVLTQVDELGALWQPPTRHRRGRVREQHLPAMCGRHQAGAAVERLVHVLARRAHPTFVGVQSHPGPQRPRVGPRLCRHEQLDVDRGRHRVRGRREHRRDAVAHPREDHAAVAHRPRSRRNSSWRANASDIASGSSSHKRVELSRSVNKKVTVPDGNSAIDRSVPFGRRNGPPRRVANQRPAG